MKSKRLQTCLAIAGAIALSVSTIWSKPASATDQFIGQIQYFPYNFAPRGWSFCNGQIMDIASNTALFSLLGTTFGGDGRVTFGLPDMRGRAPLHPRRGPGLSAYAWGERGGAETVTLTLAHLPSHTHTLNGTNTVGNQATPGGHTLARDGRERTYQNAAPDTDLHASSIESAGGNQPHDNMPPFISLNCNIAITGIFPSRS